jgi:hypothetical protein
MAVKGQIVPAEHLLENCLPGGSNDLTQEHVEGKENIDVAELEDAGTWYYVVDCATCKAVIPFKHAPEDEPILRFPTMAVRCFQCHTGHRYAPDLISHRKTAAPHWNCDGHQQPSHWGDSVREEPQDRQEDRSEGDSGVHVIIDRELHPISSSLRRDNTLNAVVSGTRTTIFFFSSCFFAAGWASQLAFDVFYPAALEWHSSALAMLLRIAFFGPVFFGLALFTFAIASFFVEAFGFKRGSIKCGFARINSRVASLAVHATSTIGLFLIDMWKRKFPTRELRDALAGRALQSRLAGKFLSPFHSNKRLLLKMCRKFVPGSGIIGGGF